MASRIPIPGEIEKRIRHILMSSSPRNRALFLFALNTGFRVSELGRITVEHVWDGKQVRDEITLAPSELKGGRNLIRRRMMRSRIVPLNAEAKSAIETYLRFRTATGSVDPRSILFWNPRTGRGLSRWQVTAIVKSLVRSAGVSATNRYGSHSLRKSFCHRVYRTSGNDINLTRAIMGHTSIATTQRYLEIETDAIRRAILAMGSESSKTMAA